MLSGTAVARATEPAPAPPPPAPPLVVSTPSDVYPYSFLDDKGQPTGFAVDLLDAVARTMHLELRRESMLALDGLRRFAAGEFDLGQFHPRIPGHDTDAEYSQPALVVQGAIFVRRGDRRFATIDDLRRKHARIATPTQGRLYALDQGIAPELVAQCSGPDALHQLAAGKVDAALMARLSGQAQVQHLGITNVETFGSSLEGFTVSYCFAAHRGQTALMARLNEGIAILHQTGEYGRIYEKWFAHYDRPAGFSREQVIGYVMAALTLALATALWAGWHQRTLRRRLARQAAELEENRRILAEAQHFARLGHSRRDLTPGSSSSWSEETFRIFERDPVAGVPELEELLRCALPADQPRWRAALDDAQHHGRNYELDLTIEPKPGHRKIINVRGRPLLDATGRQTGTFGTVQDVTESRAAAAALHQSEELLRVLYQNLPFALGVLERRGNDWLVVSFNPEAVRQIGIPSPPTPGQPLSSIGLAPERVRFWADLSTRCSDTNRPLQIEYTRPELRCTYAINIVPLGSAGEAQRCCFLSEDITARKQKDAEISQGRRLRAIGELVGGIAHEFNNLLTPIVANADLLQREWAHLPGLRDELRVIAEAASRSAELTHRLLAFGRKSERPPEPLDLRTLVEGNLDLLRHTIDRRIQLENTIPAELPALCLHSGDLHQILLNLFVNARDTLVAKLARPPSADFVAGIYVEAQVMPPGAAAPIDPAAEVPLLGWVQLTVRDNGEGIDPEVLERIFEPFYTTKEVGRGTGLGLATVWHLVADFGGRIDVESTPGEGAAFHVFLPLRPVPAAPPPPPPPVAAALAPPLSKSRHILLAEDEASVARVVLTLLKRNHHQVTHAPNGRVAWELLAAHPETFDALILDLNMPEVDGIELARRARALPYRGPLLVMSGRVSETERAALAEHQVSTILLKPFTLADFQTALDTALTPKSDA